VKILRRVPKYLGVNLFFAFTSNSVNPPRAVKRCEGGGGSKYRIQPRWLSGGHIPLTSLKQSIPRYERIDGPCKGGIGMISRQSPSSKSLARIVLVVGSWNPSPIFWKREPNRVRGVNCRVTLASHHSHRCWFYPSYESAHSAGMKLSPLSL